MAAKYIWWKSPDEAMRHPRRIITQVMDIGDYGDVRTMAHALGDAALKGALAAAEAGELRLLGISSDSSTVTSGQCPARD